MKITIAQLNYHIGNFEGNTAKMVAAIGEAKRSEQISFVSVSWQRAAILQEIF